MNPTLGPRSNLASAEAPHLLMPLSSFPSGIDGFQAALSMSEEDAGVVAHGFLQFTEKMASESKGGPQEFFFDWQLRCMRMLLAGFSHRDMLLFLAIGMEADTPTECVERQMGFIKAKMAALGDS